MAKTYNQIKNSVLGKNYDINQNTNKPQKTYSEIKSSVMNGKYNFDRIKSELEKIIQFDTLSNDLASVSKTIGDTYGGWQTQETMFNTRSSIEAMKERVNSLKEYQRLFGNKKSTKLDEISKIQDFVNSAIDNWDKQSELYGQYKNADAFNVAKKNSQLSEQFKGLSYDKVQEEKKKYKADSDEYNFLNTYTGYNNLNDFNKALESGVSKDVRDNLKKYDDNIKRITASLSNVRSQGDYNKNRDTYNKAIKEKEEYIKSLGYESVDAFNKHLSFTNNLEIARNKHKLDHSFDLYKHYTDKEDFADNSKYVSTEGNFDGLWDKFTEGQYGMGYGDITYEYINNVNGIRDEIKNKKRAYSKESINPFETGETTQEEKGYDKLNPEEIATYNYIYKTEGKDKAQTFLDDMEITLSKRVYDEQTQRWEDAVDSTGGAILHSLLSVPASVFGAIPTAIESLTDAIQGNEYNPYSSSKFLTNYASDTRKYVGENIEENTDWEIFGQNVPSFLYSTGMSLADNLLGASTLKSAYLPMMMTNAFHQKAKEMTEAGESKENIYATAFASGLAEMVFEKFSLDHFLKIKNVDGIGRIIKNALVQAGIEGSEEIATELSNVITDTVIRGENSELSQLRKSLLERGFTEKEINTELAKNVGSQVAWAGVGGALSGGVMGGVGAIGNYVDNSAQGKDIKSKERVQDLFDLANNPEIAEAYETYTRYANKGINAENVTNAQLGRLYNEAYGDAVKILNSKDATEEQRTQAFATLSKIGLLSQENVAKKKAREEGEKYNIDEKSDVDIKNVQIKDGKVVANTEKGEVSADNVSLTTRDSMLVGYAEGIAKEKGEDMANLFLSQYDGKTDVDKYAMDFNLASEYADKEFSFDHIIKNKGSLSAQMVSDIYKGTIIKAAQEKKTKFQELAKKMSDKGFYKGFVDDSVIDYDNTSAEGKINWKDLSSKQRESVEFIKGFSQVTGMNINLEANNPKLNGSYDKDNNVITINLDNMESTVTNIKDAVIPTLSHEVTHWMKEKSPELWTHLNKIVFTTLVDHYNSNTDLKSKSKLLSAIGENYSEDNLKARKITEEDLINKEYLRLVARDKKNGKEIDKDALIIEARDEIIARACEDLLSMSKHGRQMFANLTEEEKKTFVGKIKSLINDLMVWIDNVLGLYKSDSNEAQIMRQYKDQLQKASQVWDAMLKESVKVNQALEKSGAFKNKNTDNRNVVEQAKEVDEFGNSYWQIETDKDIFAGIDEVNGLQKAAYNFILHGDKGSKVTDLIDGKKLEFIRVSAREYVYGEASKKLSTEEYKQKMRMATSVIDLIENASIQYDAPDHKDHKMFPDGFKNYQGRVGIDKTIFRYIVRVGKSIDGMIFYDINLEVDGKVPRANRTSLIKSSTSNDSIRNSDKNVKENFSTKDSTGRELSKEQQEYFKDSTVRDENGNLLVMYHGTPEDFTVFDKKKARASGTYGRGFYFTREDNHARHYGKPKEYYLKIDNPLSTKDKTITKPQLRKFLEVIAKDEDYGLENYGYGSTVESVIDRIYDDYDTSRPEYRKTDFSILWDVNLTAIGDLVAAIELFNEVNGTTYDGIVLPTETVTFNSEQAKLTSNLNPTKDKDIRFSMKENVEETEDLIAVHNLSPEKLSKTLKLGGLPMPSIAITRAREGYNNFGAISLVFNKDTIDPKFFRSNKVYSGDAWTPTYPRIAYKVNEKVAEKIRANINSLVPKNVQNDLGGLHLDSTNLESELNRHGDMVTTYRYNSAMKYAFLKDNNVSIELPTTEEPFYRYGEVSNNAVISFANKMVDGFKTVNSLLEQHSSKLMADADLINGIANVLNEEVLSTIQENTEAYQKFLENPLYKPEDIDLSTVLGMLEAARRYFNSNGKVESKIDYRKAKEIIDGYFNSNSLEKEYEYWLKKTFSNIIAKEGIRNNKDLFTPSGNRRSFETLHYEHTLENVIKAMKEEGIKGIGGFGGGNIFGASTQEYGSIDEIKTDAQNRMQYLPESEYQEIKKGFSDRLFELANSLPIHKDSFSALDDAANMLIEAVSKFKTKSGMANYLRTESKGWANYSDYIVDDLIELVNDIRNMPVQYFEAKPQRAVGFDEIKAVIMPSQESYEDDLSEVKAELERLNVPVLEYEYGDNNARIKALNSIDNVKFSEKDSSIYDIMDENESLRKDLEKIKADFEKFKEMAKLDKKITNGKEFKPDHLLSVAGHMLKIGNSKMDKLELAKALKELYTYTKTSMATEEMTWRDFWDRAYPIAEKIMEESKTLTIVDDYAKGILKDLRASSFSLDETQKKEAKYIFGDHWNYNFIGNITVKDDAPNIDVMWQELSGLYPDVFSDDMGNNHIQGLYDVIQSLRETSEYVDEYAMKEKTKMLAFELYNQYWNVSTLETTADKFNAKINELKSEHKKMMNEVRNEYQEKIESQLIADDIYYGKKIQELKEKDKAKYVEKLKAQREKQREKQKELYQKFREERRQAVADAKRNLRDDIKERAERKTVMQGIMATITSLNKKLLKNDKDVHIPEALKPVVSNLINAIDYSSKQMISKGIPTQKDIALDNTFGKTKAMADGKSLKESIQDALELFENAEKIANNTSDGTLDLSLVSLDADLIDRIKSLIKSLDVLEKNYGSTFTLQQMELDHLKTLNATVKSINKWANNVDYALAMKHKSRISKDGEGTVEENDVLGKRKQYIESVESFKNFFSWSNLTPVKAFKRLGETAMKYFDGLRDAQDELAFHQEEIIQFTDELFKDKHKEIRKWREDVKEFDLRMPNGKTKTVRMPVSYVMTLYCVSKQEDAKRHLYGMDEDGTRYDNNGGGMTIAPFKVKKSLEVSEDIENTIMTESLIKQITSTLTDEQIKIADALQNFINTKGSEWCDKVSLALYGIKKFDIENYFPITVSPNTIKVLNPQDKRQSIHFFSILNYGFTKSRNPNAKQSIEIGDIFDIFANHMSMAAIYSSYALPIFDIVRWYNYKGKDAEGKEIGVITSIQKAFGKGATTYIGRLISDLNGQHEASRLGFVTKIFRNTKLAMVGNSLSVALIQPTAYLKAMTHIPMRHLLKSILYVKDFGVRNGVRKAKKYCGIALWKSRDNFDTDISGNVTSKILHDETLGEKIKSWSLKGAGWMDELTWGVLWNACEFDIRANRKDLKVGSDEFYEVVANKLRDVIYETQVVDSPLTRSDIMRSPDNLAKMLTMFGSEMTVAYNMVAEAITDAKLDVKRNGKKGALKRNAKNIAITMTAYTLTSAASQILNTMVQLMRNDEDKEPEEIMKMYFTNFLSDWLIFGKIPYVKEYLNSWQGYSSSRPDTLWMDSSVKAIKYFDKAFDGKDGYGEKAIKESLKSLSYLSGLPMYNQYRDAIGFADTLGILDAEDFKEMLDDIFD